MREAGSLGREGRGVISALTRSKGEEGGDGESSLNIGGIGMGGGVGLGSGGGGAGLANSVTAPAGTVTDSVVGVNLVGVG